MVKDIVIEGERIFLRKSSLFGWGVVYPYIVDNKINWKNLLIGGNWVRFFIMLIFVFLLIVAIFEYNTAVHIANNCLQSSNVFDIQLP